jgi:nucleotide-binding universal stress UspA family protein
MATHDASDAAPGGAVAGARQVMIATDGSEASIVAARTAAQLFAGSDFVLVTVIEEQEDPMADAGGFEGPAMDEKEAEAVHRADVVDAQGALAATARVFGDQPVHERILEQQGEGRGAKLCASAAEAGVDVLVVGSHGHGVLADALLGSVSNHVVHHSDRPVLVVPSRKKK